MGFTDHPWMVSRPSQPLTTQGRESGRERRCETGAEKEIPIEAENRASALERTIHIYFLKGPGSVR